MRGIILAGGEGSRLAPISGDKNKHLVEVAGRPMIDYPLNTLQEMGVEKVTVVTSPRHALEMVDHLMRRKQDFDLDLRLQKYPRGMADALGASAVKESLFIVLCGDTYHSPAPKLDGGVQLWWTMQDGFNHGAIWDPEINRIVEKPPVGLGNLAIIGARVYDQRAIELIPTLQPSGRGELELADIDNFYLANELEMSYYGGFFGDMGTPDGLRRIEQYEVTRR